MILSSPITALNFGSFINLAPSEGTAPYTYALKENGAGGSLLPLEDGSVTYAAPVALGNNGICVDTIICTDNLGATAETAIIVGDYLTIVCDILAHEMDMHGRVFLYNQKFMRPTDEKAYIVVSVQTTRPRGNNVHYKTINGVFSEITTVDSMAILGVDMMSRSLEALNRQDEMLMALRSTYSTQQQNRNGIRIGTIPTGGALQNMSELDGNAMLYRFRFDVSVFYSKTKIKPVDYFDKFEVREKINA